jgi:hypothetical protein
MKEIEKEDATKHIFFVGEHLAVKTPSWLNKEGRA